MSEIGLIGKKIGMAREFFKTGKSVPVTVIKTEKGRVIQLINKEKRGYQAVQIGNKLWSKATLEWDYDLNKITSSSVGLAYQEHKDKRIEIKSIYRRKGLNTVYLPWIDNNDPINQIELLMHWPVLRSFSFFSRLQKDLEKKESTDSQGKEGAEQ